MARISIEDCLEQVPNRFALVHLASQRSRQLGRGSRRVLPTKNKNIVASLREVSAGVVVSEKVLDEKSV